jgi:predicted TIM-barrel fold metal-dependent hydrolase
MPMAGVIDMEISLPRSEANPKLHEISNGRPGTPFAQPLPRPEGYGFDNYARIFKARSSSSDAAKKADDGGMPKLIEDMDRAGISRGLLVGAENSATGRIHKAYPNRFFLFVTFDAYDVMRAVREFERLVKEEGANGFRINALYNGIPANDRRYYPLFAKAVELDVPVRIYTAMNYANDRPYDLGHPRYLDDICVDFPELRVVAGLAGWPWIGDMVGLLRRHPRLYVDTSAHHPRYFAQPGSGWEQFLQFGNSLLQDKVMVGLSRYLLGMSFEEIIAEYGKLPLKEKVLEKWLFHNAREFFRLG